MSWIWEILKENYGKRAEMVKDLRRDLNFCVFIWLSKTHSHVTDFREIWRSPLRSFPVTRLIHTRHDSYIRDMTCSYATWLIHTRHDSFTCDMMEGGLWRDFRIFSDSLKAEEFWWLCTGNFPGLQFVVWVLLPSLVQEVLKRIDYENSKITIDLYIAHIKSPSPFTWCHVSTARPGVPSERRIFRRLIQNYHNLGIVKVHLNLKSIFGAQFWKILVFPCFDVKNTRHHFCRTQKAFENKMIFIFWFHLGFGSPIGFKRLSRTVPQLIIVVDPLLGSFFLW